jgi:hypothetical protein
MGNICSCYYVEKCCEQTCLCLICQCQPCEKIEERYLVRSDFEDFKSGKKLCEYENCPKKSKKCIEHRCKYKTYNFYQCYQTKLKNSNYCKEHTCSFPESLKVKYDGRTYCDTHKCSKHDCNNIIQHDSIFCEEHHAQSIKCKITSCANRTLHEYCGAHTCATSDCYSEKMSGSDYCYIHGSECVGCHKERVHCDCPPPSSIYCGYDQ